MLPCSTEEGMGLHCPVAETVSHEDCSYLPYSVSAPSAGKLLKRGCVLSHGCNLWALAQNAPRLRPDFSTTCSERCKPSRHREYMNNRSSSSAWQGDYKGEVKLRSTSQPRIKQRKISLKCWCVSASQQPHTHTLTHTESGAACGPCREQSWADGCQDTVGLVISSQLKMKKKKGKKKKNSIQLTRTPGQSLTTAIRCFTCYYSWDWSLFCGTDGKRDSLSFKASLSPLTLLSYECVAFSFVFGPQLLLARPRLLYVNPRVTTGVPRWFPPVSTLGLS